MKLPKVIRNHPKHASIINLLEGQQFKLWSQGEISVPILAFNRLLCQGLQLAKGSKAIVLGLEGIKAHLSSQPKLANPSVQHLLFITANGSERFYRHIESLLKKHPNVLCIKLEVDPETIGQELYKKNKSIKALLVEGPQAMIQFLFYICRATESDVTQVPPSESSK